MKLRRKKLAAPILVCILLFCLAIIVLGRVRSDRIADTAQTATSVSQETPPPTSAVTLEPTATPTPPPEPPDIDISELQYILINDLSYANHLKSTYQPELIELQDGQSVSTLAAEPFRALIAAAEAEGFSVYVSCGYRSYSLQEYIFNGKASQLAWSGEHTYAEAVELARKTVAFPGSSEHQLGLAADIVDKEYPDGLSAAELKDLELLRWMKENCSRHGFILRYPEHKEDITGRSFEPWHFRYVGEEAAAYIMDNEICLEEFIAMYE